jgi:DNA polymerase
MWLPSGRPINYWTPRLIDVPVPWGGTRPAVQYRAEDSVTHQWSEFIGYGGLYCNNAVQGTARDIMALALLRLRRALLDPRMSVHDEALCAVLKSMYSDPKEAAKVVADQMRIKNSWCLDLPLAVEASAGPRYVRG